MHARTLRDGLSIALTNHGWRRLQGANVRDVTRQSQRGDTDGRRKGQLPRLQAFPALARPVVRKGSAGGATTGFLLNGEIFDPRAHGIAAHKPRIIGLQQFARRSPIRHSRIEPNPRAIWIKDARRSRTAEVTTGPKPLPGEPDSGENSARENKLVTPRQADPF